MTAFKPERVLLVRLDRIGDLVMTMPVDQVLGAAWVQWWVPKGLGFVASNAKPRRRAKEISRNIGVKGFFELLGEIRNENYDAAVVFHAPWWVSLLLWLAGVPLRIGVKSQWHSFLFLNRAVRQKRSRAEASELEYNFRLLEEGLNTPVGTLTRANLRLETELKSDAKKQLLFKHGLSWGAYFVVHPGMGGSALNWPTSYYAELIAKLSNVAPVAITGTATDEKFLAPLKETLKDDSSVVWMDGKLTGSELIAVLSGAVHVYAPSTGVLHLAASTGRPTVGIYSPVRVQHPKRWGPQGSAVATLIPKVECPGQMFCLGTECKHFDCMKTVTPQMAFDSLTGLASETGPPPPARW